MSNTNTPIKKQYYEVHSMQAKNHWVCPKRELEVNIIDWLADDDILTIKAVMMTEAEFEALPEYEG